MNVGLNRPKSKKVVSASKPLVVKSYTNFSKVQYYALLGIITEVLSDYEKEKREKLRLNQNPKIDKLNDSKIAKDIYDKIGKLYPDSTFNVIIINLVGGEYQFCSYKDSTAYLSVVSGTKVFNIFKYKD